MQSGWCQYDPSLVEVLRREALGPPTKYLSTGSVIKVLLDDNNRVMITSIDQIVNSSD